MPERIEAIPPQGVQVIDNSDSYVKIELGKAGNVEFSVKAGTDGTLERLTELRTNALEVFKAVYNDPIVGKHIKTPKSNDAPF